MTKYPLYPEALEDLDRYQRAALIKLIQGYEYQGYRVISLYRFDNLYRVIVRDKHGHYLRSYFGRQAKAIHTLWHSSFHRRAIDDTGYPAEGKRYARFRGKHVPSNEGKEARGKKEGSSR